MNSQDWIDPTVRHMCLGKPSMRPPNLLPIFDEEYGSYAYQLAENWSVLTSSGTFYLPIGMILDGASVPRIFWSIYPPDGPFRAGTTLHDFLYCQQGNLWGVGETVSRKLSDDLLLELCRLYNAPAPGLMYRMVRLFGGGPWKRAKGLRIEPLRYEIS